MVWDFIRGQPVLRIYRVRSSNGMCPHRRSRHRCHRNSGEWRQSRHLFERADASASGQGPGNYRSIVLTDPPYYDAINYAGLSDFFYVWLKRSIGFLHPDLLALPLTPKREQIVMNVYGDRSASREAS